MELQKIYTQIKDGKNVREFDNIPDILTARDEDGNTLLHLAILDENLYTSEKLLEEGAYPFIYNENGMTFFSLLVQGGAENLLETVLRCYPNSLTSHEKAELLATAAVAGQSMELKLMIEFGFDVETDYRGESIISWALQSKCVEIIKLLHSCGAPIDRADEAGMTPLYKASSEGLVDIVEYLIEIGSNINYSSDSGCTPLIIACLYKQEGVVRKLLEFGADTMQKDSDGKTVLDYAKEIGYNEIIDLLSSDDNLKVHKPTTTKQEEDYKESSTQTKDILTYDTNSNVKMN